MRIRATVTTLGVLLVLLALLASSAFARDVTYEEGEIEIRVNPGEPTQLQFPGPVAGGFRKSASVLNVSPKDNDLVIFSGENLSAAGESIIVRLQDGRSYAVRVLRATPDAPRDPLVSILDARAAPNTGEEEDPIYRDPNFEYAPPSQVAGLMREMILHAEFGKKNIPGYRISEAYKGQPVLNDGTVMATVDKILIGPNLWGYVLDTANMLDTPQLLNHASFRLDGTRAIVFEKAELAAKPLTVEQQISQGDKSKVYIVVKARK
jgi:hypothetical protein